MSGKTAVTMGISAALLLVAAVALVLLMGGQPTVYRLQAAPDAATVERAIWTFQAHTLVAEDGGAQLSVLSVSPSGRYILAADQKSRDFKNRLAAGVPNPYGILPRCLYIFTHQDEGQFILTGQMDMDLETDLELSATLGMCREDGVAWSADESHAVLTVDLFESREYLRDGHSNLFLLDFKKQTARRLTDATEPAVHNLLPRWEGDSVRFIRWQPGVDGVDIDLMSLNLRTGREQSLANLVEGGIALVFDYAVHGDRVYFAHVAGGPEYSGLYAATLGDDAPAECLISMESLQETLRSNADVFFSVQASADGRLLCLTVHDSRFMAMDLPLIDHRELPQDDPRSAVSPRTGEPWVPCYNVFLYDLESNTLIDPFIHEALQPYAAIVTAATFAPDGKSLLCAVFGDGGVWSIDSLWQTSLYQIRLDEPGFETMKVYETQVALPPNRLTWLQSNAVLVRSWPGYGPNFPVALHLPAAFEGF